MTDQTRLPDGVLLAFYGDDFTGSSAVMEVMTFAGLPAVMFVETPTHAQLQRFSNYRAIGIASVARAQSPRWMDAHLPSAFRALAELRAPVNHYKVCSTLDSSPTVGSIGRAIEIGVPIFRERLGAADWQPLVVAAPGIGRYQAFGNLFATHQGRIFRLDRHPVMQRHPVTPMDEADVGTHVGRQTASSIGLVDFVAMKNGVGLTRFEAELAQGPSIVSLDVVDDETLRWVGKLIWEHRGQGVFAIGSQGVEYALVAHWRSAGMLQEAAAPAPASKLPHVVAVSGSISAVTAAQTDWATANGFEMIPLDASASLDNRRWNTEIDSAVKSALAALSSGRSPLVATARGPTDGSVAKFLEKLSTAGVDSIEVNGRIGSGLGDILQRVMRAARIQAGRRVGRRHVRLCDAGARRLRARGHSANRARRTSLSRVFNRPGDGRMSDHVERRANGRRGFFWIGSRGRRNGLGGNDVTKIALLGAGGKMGMRLSTNLKDTRFEVDHVEVSEEGRARLKEKLDVECMEQGQAVSSADAVVMAVPDRLIGKILKTFVGNLRSGAKVIMLDAAAPHAGELPTRDDVTYFVTHPCHPPIFNDETDPKAKTDYFGGIFAKQHIVCALMQGPESHYAECEEMAREIYKPVMRAHRCTVEQLAILEPALSETVGATFALTLREATDEAIKRGVPKQAAIDFIIGHLNIELAIAFGIFPEGRFSDGALQAIDNARPVIFRDGWLDEVFSSAAVLRSVKDICEAPAAS